MSDKIDTIDSEILEWHDEWARNRDFVEGERAVKHNNRERVYADGKRFLNSTSALCSYIPREGGLTDDQMRNIVKRTRFFPGAARTHEGLLGLIFRKPATVEAPAALGSILETITPDYLTIDDLAEEVTSEFLITNFVGLLVDVKAAQPGLSVAQAEKRGARPFIAVYRAESILGIEPGLLPDGSLGIVRVRLQDKPNVIRELRFDDGRYSVTLWERDTNEGEYRPGETIYPLRNGALFEAGVPFTLVATNRRYAPAKPKLSDVCSLNAQHFIASFDIAALKYAVGRPTPYLFGPTSLSELKFGFGEFMSGVVKSGGDVKLGFFTVPPEGIAPLVDDADKISSDMAKVGSRILADEKAAVEAAETQKVKMASENAALASTARFISRKITDALKWVAYWLGYEEGSISYEANTDYGNAALSKDEIEVRFKLYQGDIISKDALLDMLIDGEVLPESFDKELDSAKLNEEIADRPPVIGAPLGSGDD